MIFYWFKLSLRANMHWTGVALFKDTMAFPCTVLHFPGRLKNHQFTMGFMQASCFAALISCNEYWKSTGFQHRVYRYVKGPAASPGQSVESGTPIPQIPAISVQNYCILCFIRKWKKRSELCYFLLKGKLRETLWSLRRGGIWRGGEGCYTKAFPRSNSGGDLGNGV